MTTEKKTLHEEAMELLERINTELKDHKLLDTLNIKMVGVVKDLNDVRIGEITGKTSPENETA
jgi:ribosome-binding factor A